MDECVMIFGLSPALELNPHVGICPLGNCVVGAGVLQVLVKGKVKVALIAGSEFLQLIQSMVTRELTPQQALLEFKSHPKPESLYKHMQDNGMDGVHHDVQRPGQALWIPPGYLCMMAACQ